MKYILVIDHIATGGAERILIDYYHHLEAKGDKPYIFVLSGHDGQSAWTEGLRIVYGTSGDEDNLLKKAFQQLCLYFKLRRVIQRVKPDVVFSFLEKSNLLTVLAPGKATKVLTVHNVLSIQYTKVRSGIVRKLLYAMIRWAYNRCPNVVAVSRQVEDDLLQSFGVIPSHVHVINNYVDRKAIRKKALEPVDNFRFEEGTRYVMNIGRFSDQKAQWKLLKAFSLCIKDGLKNACLVLMGNGDHMEDLKRLTEDLSLEKYTTFLPFNVNPYKYMVHANLFVLSSIFEGFPIVLAEASSLRIPFIGARKAVPEEMFDDSNVWEQCIFDSSTLAKDFTTTIHEDEKALAALIQRGLEDVEFQCSLLRHTSRWEMDNDKTTQFRLYDELCQKERG